MSCSASICLSTFGKGRLFLSSESIVFVFLFLKSQVDVVLLF